MKSDKIPSALIRALESHFIYEDAVEGHLRFIPSFIEPVFNAVKPGVPFHILKRFTGRLLGYLLHDAPDEFTLIIPCVIPERREISFLIRDSIMETGLDDTSYAVKLIFLGSKSNPLLFSQVFFSGIQDVYFSSLLNHGASIFHIDLSRENNERYFKLFRFPSFWKPYNPIVYSLENGKGHHNEVIDKILEFTGAYHPLPEEIQAHIIT
jgi:hypothetical protein